MRLGIDFGTTNSGVGFYDGHRVHILPLDPDSPDPGVIRTLLYLTREGDCYIGRQALDTYYEQNIGRARRMVKQQVGEIEVVGADMYYVRDVHVMVDELTPGRLFQSVKSGLKEANFVGTQVFDRSYTLEELIALYLAELRRRASLALGREITRVVVGRPVNFGRSPEANELAQRRLDQAAKLAGFAEITFELEPVAAALSYARILDRPQRILVFDFGGGTLDLTVMHVSRQGERQVLATGGIDVAGDTFDRAIIRHRLLDHFGRGTLLGERALPFPVYLTESLTSWQEIPSLSKPETLKMLAEAQAIADHPSRIRTFESLLVNNYGFALFDVVERAKRELSERFSAVIRLQGEDLDLWHLITRFQFETIITGYRREIAQEVEETIGRSGLTVDQIDAVVRTGGSSQIPCFIALLADLVGPHRLRLENTFSGVTAGLAIRAWELDRDE